jgi:glycogen debranching enzyme
MAALRLPIKDTDHMVFLPAAGLPSARRQQEQVLTVASNPGHCLWCGIVPRERAKKVVDRLMAPDMWTGWGIRTLSADHRAQCHHRHGVQILWL